jgi:tetratricopeptide (TPR) repeat protein
VTRAKIERWQGFVANDPENKLHQFALAGAYLQATDYAAGEQAYGRCLELDPQWMMAAIKRGRCLVELGRTEEARAALELGAELAQAQNHDEPFEEIRELMDQLPPS